MHHYFSSLLVNIRVLKKLLLVKYVFDLSVGPFIEIILSGPYIGHPIRVTHSGLHPQQKSVVVFMIHITIKKTSSGSQYIQLRRGRVFCWLHSRKLYLDFIISMSSELCENILFHL